MDAVETLQSQIHELETVMRFYDQEKPDEIQKRKELEVLWQDKNKSLTFLQKTKGKGVPSLEGKDSFLYKNWDIKNLLEYAKEVNLPYRSLLSFDAKYRFGMEIEVENIDRTFLNEWMQKKKSLFYYYECHKEETVESIINGNRLGCEVVTPPYHNKIQTWKELEKVCTFLKRNGARITKKCGGHIHGDAAILDYEEETVKKVLKLWAVYEPVFFRLFMGDFYQVRDLTYAEALQKLIVEKINYIDTHCLTQIKSELFPNKRKSFNILNFDAMKSYAKNTLELRFPNGSLNPWIWQNHINIFIHFLLCCRNTNELDTYIQDKMKKWKTGSTTAYTEMHLEEVLALCDLLFENNRDKYALLKEYLHSYQNPKETYIPNLNDGQPPKIMVK